MKIYCFGLCPIIVVDNDTAKQAGEWIERTTRQMVDAEHAREAEELDPNDVMRQRLLSRLEKM